MLISLFKKKSFIWFKAIFVITAFLMFFCLMFSQSVIADETAEKKQVFIIPVEGEVGPLMATFISRSVEEIPKKDNVLIIFELDTFGGRVDSAFDIVDTITEITGAETLAYVKTKAISAGSLIALSCDGLVMKNGTTIGDCAPISIGPDGPAMLGEKFQSPLRARFRALAKRNGYNENLAESMVSEDLEIIRIVINGKMRYVESVELDDMTEKERAGITDRKTIVKKGQLLTMDDKEAEDLGFSKASVADIDSVLAFAGAEGAELSSMKYNWTEHFLSAVILITPFLMMVGFYAVYLEIKTPGFGIPGIVGLICLSLAFGAQFLVGNANYTELLLILLGFVLLGFEVFVIPGFGLAGIAGFVFIAIGLILSLQNFVLPKPSMPWQGDIFFRNIVIVFGSYVLAVSGGLLTFRYVLPGLSFRGHGPYLKANLEDAKADSEETLKARVGDEGVALSYLRPSGKILIGRDIFDVLTEGEFIEKGSAVAVSKISGNTIVVRRKEVG